MNNLVCIPMADGETLAHSVYSRIAAQSIKPQIMVITRPRDLENFRISQNESRNECRRYANGDYVYFLDSDVCLQGFEDLEDMGKFLQKNPEWDAVALDTKNVSSLQKYERTGDVVIACIAVWTEALQQKPFRIAMPEETGIAGPCPCIAFNIDYKIKYLDNRLLSEVKRGVL